MTKKKKIAVISSMAVFLAIIIFGYKMIWGDKIVAEYRKNLWTYRVVEERLFPFLIANYILEIKFPLSKAYRFPLFVALDFWSDANPGDYKISYLHVDDSMTLVTIGFADGLTLYYPLFMGAFSRDSFTAQWADLCKQHRDIQNIPHN